MKHRDIVEYFTTLQKEDQTRIINQLIEHLTLESTTVLDARQTHINKAGLICPKCRGKDIVGNGSYKETKRYKCKSCKSSFNPLTGTTFHWIHKKELLREYLYFMLQGYSLRKICGRMDICLKTAFDWRHKILRSLSTEDNTKLSGIVEADETFFLFSEKGNKQLTSRKARKRGGEASKKGINSDHVTVLTAYERKTNQVLNTVVCRGRITKNAIETGLGKWLDKQQCTLCTDSHKSFEGFAMDNGIEIKRIFVRRKEYVINKIYHTQHVNNIHGNLKRWMFRFNGVATKYLQNYMNYFNFIRGMGEGIHLVDKAIQEVLRKENVYMQRNQLNHQKCIT